MAEYRGGFGLSPFGSYNFGLDGFVTDGAGTIISVTTTASAALRVRLTSSIAIAAASNDIQVTRVRSASATVQ